MGLQLLRSPRTTSLLLTGLSFRHFIRETESESCLLQGWGDKGTTRTRPTRSALDAAGEAGTPALERCAGSCRVRGHLGLTLTDISGVVQSDHWYSGITGDRKEARSGQVPHGDDTVNQCRGRFRTQLAVQVLHSLACVPSPPPPQALRV